MDILKIISDPSRYYVKMNLGKSFERYIEDDEDEYNFVVPVSNLIDSLGLQKLFAKYHIHSIFGISNCYLGTQNEPHMFWHVSKTIPLTIKVSSYMESSHPYRDNKNSGGVISVSDKYEESFLYYVTLLDSWLETGNMPNDEDQYEFNEIDVKDFEYDKLFDQYYRKANESLRKTLKSEQIVPLKDVADIVNVHYQNDVHPPQQVKRIDCRKLFYPYSQEMHTIDYITSEKVHKGDIFILPKERNVQSFFLVDKESTFDLYAPPQTVIRARKVSPEYLYIYLNSQIAQRILSINEIRIGEHIHINLLGRLEDFPVVLPKQDECFYKAEFLKISSPDKRYYGVSAQKLGENSIEQLLSDEWTKIINQNNMKLVQSVIEKDIEELNACFYSKAYKATLILAGSIMEAFLIDWLSELKGIDYFTIQLCKRVYDKKQKCYITGADGEYIYDSSTRADLADYIDEIKDIKAPYWHIEAKAAEGIRKKRNLVHAKLCIANKNAIDEKTCKGVISDLNQIIESRFK